MTPNSNTDPAMTFAQLIHGALEVLAQIVFSIAGA